MNKKRLNICLFGDDNIDWDGILGNKYYSYPNNTVTIDGRQYIIQCPDTIDENTTFYIASRGAGGVGDASSTLAAANGKNVIVILPVNQDNGDYPAAVDVMNTMANHLGIENNATFSGHSNSGPLAMQAAQKYIQETGNPTTIILNDPSTQGGGDKNIDYSNFKDSLIINYTPSAGGASKSSGFDARLQKAAAAGAKVLVVRYSNGDHGSADDVAASMGAYDPATMQLIDNGSYVNSHGGTYNSNYKYQWMDENGNLHDFANAEEAQAFLDDALIEITGSLWENCDSLEEFASKFNGKGDTLASNLVFVSNSMNDLKGKIVAREDFNYSGAAGEAQIINAMYSAADYYSGINNKVYSNLSSEADAIYAIANGIFNMDQAASMVAETALTENMQRLYSTSNPEIADGLEKLNAATQSLLDEATSLCDTTKYESLQGMLTTGDGNIGKMSRSAINDAVNSIVPVLQQEVTTAQGLKSSLESFMGGIGGDNLLQGGVWENVANNLEAYGNLLDSSVAASEYMQDVLETALGMYVNFFDNANKEVLSGISSAGCGEFAGAIDGIIGSLQGFHDDEEIDTNNKDILDEAKSRLEQVEQEAQQLYDENKQKFDGECVPWPHQEDECTGTDANGNCTGWRKVWVKVEPSVCEGYQERMAVAEAAMNSARALIGVVDYQLDRINTFVQITEQASEMMMDAIENIKSVYENPASIMEGNGDFKDKFKLDLSKYGIDDSTNYKQILNDYYEAIKPAPAAETNPEGSVDPTAAAGNENPAGTASPGGTPGGSPSGGDPGSSGGVAPGPNVEMPTKNPTVTPTTTPSPTTPTVTRPTYTTPTYTTPTPTPTKQPTTPTTTTSTPTPTTPGTQPSPSQTVIIATTESGDEIVVPTEQKGGNVIKMGKGGTGGYTKTTEKGNYSDINSGEVVIDNPVIEAPITDDFNEPLIIEPEPAQVSVNEIQAAQPAKENKGVKTMGIAAGIGLAVGAAALGAHALVKSKDDDEDEDYGYDK